MCISEPTVSKPTEILKSVMTYACHPNLGCHDNSVSQCKHCWSIRFMAVFLQWLLKDGGVDMGENDNSLTKQYRNNYEEGNFVC